MKGSADRHRFPFKGRVLGHDKPALIIAEIGTAHSGDRSKAAELITAAAESRAEVCKFQWVIADEIIHPRTGQVDLPGGPTDLYRRFRSLEQPREFYAYLKTETEKRGMEFLCSPFGRESLQGLASLGETCVKIASPELNYYPLLKGADAMMESVILSTGVSRLGDIENALTRLSRPAALLHCVTSYPAPEEDYNLRVLPHLREIFGSLMGVSDHSADPLIIPLLAVLAGGRILEKHFTLKKDGDGLDDPIALTPPDFERMVHAVRQMEQELDTSPPEDVFHDLKDHFGSARVESILGSGKKELAPSEAGFYRRTNRSLHALRELPAGTILTEENTALLRTESSLDPGLPPEWQPAVMGKKIRRRVPDGGGITLNDLL